MDEVFAIADRVTVMRNGRTVMSSPIAETSREALVSAMVGETQSAARAARHQPTSEPALVVEGARAGKLDGVSFVLRRGEIVGLGGLHTEPVQQVRHAVLLLRGDFGCDLRGQRAREVLDVACHADRGYGEEGERCRAAEERNARARHQHEEPQADGQADVRLEHRRRRGDGGPRRLFALEQQSAKRDARDDHRHHLPGDERDPAVADRDRRDDDAPRKSGEPAQCVHRNGRRREQHQRPAATTPRRTAAARARGTARSSPGAGAGTHDVAGGVGTAPGWTACWHARSGPARYGSAPALATAPAQ